MDLLPFGQSDSAVQAYLATLGSAATARVQRSHLEQVARWLLGLPDAQRPRAIGGRRLHIDLARVPWSSVTVADAARVAQAALGGPRSRRTVGCMLGAFKGVLRAAGVLTVGHLDELRVDQQLATGRTVKQVVAEWVADELADGRDAYGRRLPFRMPAPTSRP